MTKGKLGGIIDRWPMTAVNLFVFGGILMDQLLIIGLGDIGAATVASTAKALLSNKVRVNGGRICCASIITKDYSDYMAREGVISAKVEDISAALDTLDENENGRLQVILTAALDGITAEDCLNTVSTVKSYFCDKNLDVEMKGVFILSDKKSSNEKAVITTLTNSGNSVFDNLYFVKNESEAGPVYPDTDSLVADVSRMISLAFISSLSSEFDAREKQAMAIDSFRTVCGIFGYSKASYLYENIAQYCGLRGAMDVINQFWIAIDREISQKHNGRNLPAKEFRKEYISAFEERASKKDVPNNFFPNLSGCIYNETITLNEDDSENCVYSHKVDDFVCITERFIEVYSKGVAFDNYTAFSENDADGFIAEMNVTAENIASKLTVNAIPLSKGNINCKNDASVFGLISNEKGDIAEERVYSHPVAARYLFYKLSDRLTDIYYGLDLKTAVENLKSAFASQENKDTTAFEYLNTAVKLAFIKQFTDRLEKFIRQFEDFFAGIPSVWDNFNSQLRENLAFVGSESPANISIGIDPAIKDDMYRERSFPMNGMPPVGPNIITMISNLFFSGENSFDNVTATLPKSDPVYSLEYNLGASYKKYYMRNKDVSVNNDIYHACGLSCEGYSEMTEADREAACNRGFAATVDALISAATPVACEKEPSILWTISPALSENCPNLGDFLGVDVNKYQARTFDKSILECFTTVYDIDPQKL